MSGFAFADDADVDDTDPLGIELADMSKFSITWARIEGTRIGEIAVFLTKHYQIEKTLSDQC
mgnify:CR=1 FL=1